MRDNLISSQVNTFENPFEDINANVIDPQRILTLWCTPFSGKTNSMSENKFRTNRLPIILQGSRGSGKTTILKYFSYPVQVERAKKENTGIFNQIIKEKSVGFYFRCDDSFINTFKSIFQNKSRDSWISFFEHYIELQFANQLIVILEDILKTQNTDYEAIQKALWSIIYEYTNKTQSTGNALEAIRNTIDNEIHYIDVYKNESIFSDSVFRPSMLLSLYSISEKLIDRIFIHLLDMQDTVFLLLIDEFENLTVELQQFFNTKIKFVKNNISIRIGRRSEGVITTATINDTEYLRQNHDYLLYEISKGISLPDQKKYFSEIAEKRLSLCSDIKFTNGIIGILGDKENLDEECINICKGRDEHLRLILSEKASLKSNPTLLNEIIDIIKYPDNPIAETLNALWVIRNNDDPLSAAQNTVEAMHTFFSKGQSPSAKKYESDYNNKYRYSITALLASLYKRKKMYYGFNAIVHLSNGNARTFINICRAIISDALFYEKQLFLSNKTISKESQNRAIGEFAESEFESICSIIDHGNKIRNLIMNIGNTFAEYHKDKKIRYPETNQFVFNRLTLPDDYRAIIDIAESWSIIEKRPKAQRISLGTDKKGDLFFINRAFCPIFGISYRTRGGFNVSFTKDELIYMMTALSREKKINKSDKKPTQSSQDTNVQMSLFDYMEDNNDE